MDVETNGKPEDFDDEEKSVAYWLTRPMEERIAYVEVLRRRHWGEDYETRIPFDKTAVSFRDL